MMILCMDIGGTYIKFAVFDWEGKQQTEVKSIKTQITKTDNNILKQVKGIISDNLTNLIEGIAISSAGVVDDKKGQIIYSGYTIPNYAGTSFKKMIRKEFNLPSSVINDVNAALLGEYWKGAGKNCDSLVCLTIGTGVGGAIMLDKEIVKGKTLTAGELGYMLVGNNQKLQDIASTKSLIDRVNSRISNYSEKLDGYEIIDLAKSGDVICNEELDVMIDALGNAILNLMYIINPDKIILGGGIMDEFNMFKTKINNFIDKQVVDSYFNSTEIVPAINGNKAGMIGALYHFNQEKLDSDFEKN